MSNIKRVVLGLIAVVGMVFIALAGFGSSATALPAAGVVAPVSSGSSLPGGYTSSGSGPTSASTSPSTSSSSTTSSSSSSSGTGTKPNCTTSSSGDTTCSGFDAESAVCVGTSPGAGDVDKGTANADGTFSGIDTSGVSAGTTVYVSPCGDTDAADAAQITVAGGSSSSSGGNLSSTGVAVIGIGAIGLVLLVGGALMLLAGRRRGGSHA
jgi:hypothetical protein